MICETCHRRGVVWVTFWEPVPGAVGVSARLNARQEPCPDCGGCGHTHCCEGERPDTGMNGRLFSRAVDGDGGFFQAVAAEGLLASRRSMRAQRRSRLVDPLPSTNLKR